MGDASAGSSVELRESLCRTAARLVERARRDDGRVTWVAPVATPDPHEASGWGWRTTDTPGPALYDGLAGIARGLALAAPVVQPTQPHVAAAMRELAAAALRQALAQAEEDAAFAAGLYDGAMGVACAAVEAGRLLRDAAVEEAGRTLGLRTLTRASAAPPDDWDLVAGRAGLVCGAAWLAGWTRQLEDLTTTFAALLPADADAPVAIGPGLAHGLAGIAVAHAHAWRLGRDPARLAALTALQAHEHDWYSPEHEGWPDIRQPGHYPAWWCHGATGIGLARLRVTALTGGGTSLGVAADVAAARAAVHAALASGALGHHDWSLCHGLGGAVAFLLAAPDPRRSAHDVRVAVEWLLDGSREADRRDGWAGGAPVPRHQPGLMTGEAGLLLLLARAAVGERACRWPLWL